MWALVFSNTNNKKYSETPSPAEGFHQENGEEIHASKGEIKTNRVEEEWTKGKSEFLKQRKEEGNRWDNIYCVQVCVFAIQRNNVTGCLSG